MYVIQSVEYWMRLTMFSGDFTAETWNKLKNTMHKMLGAMSVTLVNKSFLPTLYKEGWLYGYISDLPYEELEYSGQGSTQIQLLLREQTLFAGGS